MQSRTRSCVPLLCAVLLLACSHETVWIGEEPAAPPALGEPLPMTVGVVMRVFEAERIRERALLDRVGRGLRDSGVFRGVIYPLPPGTAPVWELQLIARDGAVEADANFWKGALAAALLPLAPFLWFENEYRVELEALLVRRGELVGSYRAEGAILHRYQYYADRAQVGSEGLERAVAGALGELLEAIQRDAVRLRAEDT